MKKTNFSRILLITVFMLALIANVCMTVSAAQEAVLSSATPSQYVFKFNNPADISAYKGEKATKAFYDVDGKLAMSLTATTNDTYTFLPEGVLSEVNLANYPYLVLGTRYSEVSCDTQLYFGWSGSPLKFIPFKSDYFTKTVFNLDKSSAGKGKYTVYDASGSVVKTATDISNYSTRFESDANFWSGTLTAQTRFDMLNDGASIGKTMQWEYIGFFATEKDALDYAGAMPNDADAQSIITALNNATLALEGSVTAQSALTLAQAEIDEATATAVSAVKAKGIQNVTVTAISGTLSNNEYTCKVRVSVGDKSFQRTVKDTTIVLDVESASDITPAPYVFKFNNQTDINSFYTPHYEGKALYDADGKLAMSLTANNADGISKLSVSALGEVERSDYPYIVFSTKYPTDCYNREVQIFGFDKALKFKVLGKDIFTKTVLNLDEKSDAYCTYTVYDASGTVVGTAKTPIANYESAPTGFWTGKFTDDWRLDWLDGKVGSTMQLEYIGFFATEKEALDYAGAMPNDADAQSIIDALDDSELALTKVGAGTDAWLNAAQDVIDDAVANAVAVINNRGIANVTVTALSGTRNDTVYTCKVRIAIGDKAYQRTVKDTTVEIAVDIPDDDPDTMKNESEYLSQRNSFTAGSNVITKKDAEAAADAYIEECGFVSNVNIDYENAVFNRPTSDAAGTYVFDVLFGSEPNDEYTVSVTINIPKLTKPVMLYMDNKTIFQKLSSTSNAELIYNGGVIGLNSVKPEVEDGFQINLSFPNVAPKFNINDLPYIKVRYKISGIHKNISGGAVPNPWGSFQIYYGINNDTAVSLCRAFTPYTGTGHQDDDILEVIVNMKDIPQNDLEERVYIQNITQNTEKYIDFTTDRTECYDNTDTKIRDNNTKYSVMRFNFMRQSNLPRNAEVYYIGFFPSFEEAKAYDSIVEQGKRLDDAEAKLRSLGASGAVAIWGDVAKEKTEIDNDRATLNPDGTVNLAGVRTKDVIATNGLMIFIEEQSGGLGGNIKLKDYIPSTADTKGKHIIDIELRSGDVKRTVTNIEVPVAEKPDDYIMWRFNDPALLSDTKVKIAAVDNPKIEDNLLKLDNENPVGMGAFKLTIDSDNMPGGSFRLQNYQYILIKHKRMTDVMNCSFVFKNKAGTTGSISNMGWGQQLDNWYYTLIDPYIPDRYNMWAYNYNIDTGILEKNGVNVALNPPVVPAYIGMSDTFEFSFGVRRYADLSAEIEFIAFFPSMADARNYVQNIEVKERVTSNTELTLRNYTGETVDFYDGNTLETAQAKALGLIDKMLLDNEASVVINDVSYTAPELGATDGSYVFTADVKYNNEVIYTTGNITLTVSKSDTITPVIYKFTNPEFVKEISKKAVCDYTAMTITADSDVSFTFNTDLAKTIANLNSHKAMKLGADFTGTGIALSINGSTLADVDFEKQGEDIYIDLNGCDFDGIVERITVVFKGATTATVEYLGFYENIVAAKIADLTATPDTLNAAAALFPQTKTFTDYQEGKTISDAKMHTEKYINHIFEGTGITGVAADNITYTNYVPSTKENGGSIDVSVRLSYGDKTETYYKTVNYKTNFQPKPADEVVPTYTSEGHEFLGYDTITASKDLVSVPDTIEFNIMVSQADIAKEMPIITNGSATVKLVDGKITVGTLQSSALNADKWTRVTITSDGKIYLDGVLDTEGSAVTFTTNAPIIGGASDVTYKTEKGSDSIENYIETINSYGFIGHLKDVRFLSDDELLAHWSLTADSYKWLEYFDSSNNENTATFNSTGWYKMEAGLQGDYSIIQFGDTQSYFYFDRDKENNHEMLPYLFKWMAENKDKYNIGYVTLLGDATQNNTRFEWDVVRESFKYLDDAMIPYAIPLGNHDYPSPSSGLGQELRDPSRFLEAFDYDEYVGRFGDTFGGTFNGAKSLENMYSLANIGGVDYIFITLEYGPRDTVLEWVGNVLTKYPNHQAIISTHCYFSTDGTLTNRDKANATKTDGFSDGNEGLDIYNKLVTKYPNVILVTCGHSQGDDTKQHPHSRDDSYLNSPTANDFGNDVIQILADCSAYALDYSNGGRKISEDQNFISNHVKFGSDEGLIFVMMFEDGGKTMHTYVYSTIHDAFFRSVNEQTHTIKDIKTQPALNVVGTELREADGELPMGMRFKMSLSKSYENFKDNDIKVVGYGMVLVPEDVVGDEEITAEMFKGTDMADLVYVEECQDAIFYQDKYRTDFTVVIHGVPLDNEYAMSRSIAARAYVDYTVDGGEVQRLYSTKTLSCFMNSLINP
ncbi:MAG: hypothetical protein E7588_08925 [Ruminococcaceae bacterium]|nr:hypothetical protein [Oscillospiraceae bacterium]